MFLRRLYGRFFVTRKDYRELLTYLKFSQEKLKQIRELIEGMDESVYQCFHQSWQETIGGKRDLFKEISDYLYCVEIFLNKCKQIIKDSSQTKNKEILEAAGIVLSSLNGNYINETFIYRQQKKPLLEKYIKELHMIFLFQMEHIPPTLKYDGSKEDLYVIIEAVNGLAVELEKLYTILSSFISFLEEEGKRISDILKEGQDLCRHISIISNLIMQNRQFMGKITPKHTAETEWFSETGWLSEKRFTNTLNYMEGYRTRLRQYLEYSREYIPSIEEKSAQEYLVKLNTEIARIEQKSQIYKSLYDAYLLDDQRTMAMIIKEQNPESYVGYNLNMTAYCGVSPKRLVRGIRLHDTVSEQYILPEAYARKMSEIVLREGYRPSYRNTPLNHSVFGSYTPKNIFFYPKKHTGYGGSIALVGLSVSKYCVLSYGSEGVIMTPNNLPPKSLTLYVQDPERLVGGLEFVGVNVQGEGYMDLQDYIIRFKAELENLHTPFKVDHWG